MSAEGNNVVPLRLLQLARQLRQTNIDDIRDRMEKLLYATATLIPRESAVYPVELAYAQEHLHLSARMIRITWWVLMHQDLAYMRAGSCVSLREARSVTFAPQRSPEEKLKRLPETLRALIIESYGLEDEVMALRAQLYPESLN